MILPPRWGYFWLCLCMIVCGRLTQKSCQLWRFFVKVGCATDNTLLDFGSNADHNIKTFQGDYLPLWYGLYWIVLEACWAALVKVMSICIAPIHETPFRRSGIARIAKAQFYLYTIRFIRKQNESYLPLPSQSQLVLIYRPQRDGRLSRRSSAK